MDHQKQNQIAKSKNKILKLLPKAASVIVAFHQNPPYSPSRDKKRSEFNNTHMGSRGFSGPIISIIPDQVRRKSKCGNYKSQNPQPEEPTSPKVSCMGQVKHKKKVLNQTEIAQFSKLPHVIKQGSTIRRILFSGTSKPAGRKSDASPDNKVEVLPDRAASLSQMKIFASGRDQFISNFDWTTQISPLAPTNLEQDRGESYGEEIEDIGMDLTTRLGISLKPRKEINLWKRRTMAPPAPLQLHTY